MEHDILERIADCYYGLDGGWRFVYVNRHAEAHLRRPRSQLLGRPIFEVFPEAEALLRPRYERVVAEQVHARFEMLSPVTGRWIEVDAHPAGETLAVFFRDITPRWLAAIVEDAHDAIVSKTIDGRITAWNRAAERMFGYPADEAIGQPITLIIPPERFDEERDILVRLRRGETIDHFETERMAKDGRRVPISLTVSPVRDASGAIVGASKVARDISERKENEARLRFTARASELLASSLDYAATLRQVAQLAVPDIAAGCVVDLVTPDGSLERVAVAHADPEVEALAWQLARRMRRASAHPLYRVVTSGQADLCEHVTDALRAQLSPGPEYAVMLDPKWFESFMVVPLKTHGVTVGTISLVVGAGRRYDTNDTAFVEDLARRAAQAIENARLYRKLETANRNKDEFLAMLAHELRNPLGVIVNALAVLDRAGGSAPEPTRARGVIRRQTEHLARLLDDLLDVARIDSGRIALRLEPVDLRAAVDVAVEAQRPRIETKRQQLTVAIADQPLVVIGDTARLQQVLGNLLNNATKYTPPGGAISVRLTEESGEARLRVRDTGVGLPADMLEQVFDLFTQAHPSLARSEGGLGVGLTLVKRIVELHRGTVVARSEGPGRGAEFDVRLPLARVLDPAPAAEPAPAAPRRRVLVIEDNDDGRDMLTTALRLEGHEVLAAATGREGIELARRQAPEVLLIDIGLPDVDGYEVCRSLRRDLGPTPRLIALTGYGQPRDRERALAAGFDDHLVKPVDPDRLRDVLRQD